MEEHDQGYFLSDFFAHPQMSRLDCIFFVILYFQGTISSPSQFSLLELPGTVQGLQLVICSVSETLMVWTRHPLYLLGTLVTNNVIVHCTAFIHMSFRYIHIIEGIYFGLVW